MKFLIQRAKIKKALFSNGNNYTVVVVPADDAYSQPTSYKVKSDDPLGQEGQEVSLEITISGFVREKKYKDNDTGQQKIYDEAVVMLDAKHAQRAKQTG